MSSSNLQQRQASSTDVPNALRGGGISTTIIRETIWRPAARGNDWRVFAIVGREGSGKSLTAAAILRACDPTFGTENAHFGPVPFLQDIGRDLERPGVAALSDESGVAFGNRTWHDREQIEANQYLQTARDHNRIIGMTAPRMEELDKQLQGRIHVVAETVQMRKGEWVELKWKIVDPSRTGEDTIYKKYPRLESNGRREKITRIKVGPPPEELAREYQEKKAAWKQDLKDRVLDRYADDEEEDQQSPGEIAKHIQENEGVEPYIKDNNGQRYLDRGLLIGKYDLSQNDAKAVKSLLLEEVDGNVM
jgi:hypothetical protein